MMASYSPEGAERALRTPLRQQYEALIHRGITPGIAAREVRSTRRRSRVSVQEQRPPSSASVNRTTQIS
jgi:hypothetical protein